MSERFTKIEIEVSDGTRMPTYVYRPKGTEPAPVVIVLQEAFGVNAHIQKVARAFSDQGYVAIAPSLFHRTGGDYQDNAHDFEKAKAHYLAVTLETQENDFRALHAWIKEQRDMRCDRLAAIGYCMGGRAAYLANTVLPLKAAVCFYGGGIPAFLDRVPLLHGETLFFWGGKDQAIPSEDVRTIVDALKKAGKPFVNVEFSDAGHAFSNEDRPNNYSPSATRRALAVMDEFLRSHLK
jgi:carboxymethylenebutenolidase